MKFPVFDDLQNFVLFWIYSVMSKYSNLRCLHYIWPFLKIFVEFVFFHSHNSVPALTCKTKTKLQITEVKDLKTLVKNNFKMDGTVTASSNFYNSTPSLDSGGDANAALAELDQNLRCGRLGEQAEAIVRFPSLFTKYPFPILINSALLKLADVFRQGSNFLRLCVLRYLTHRCMFFGFVA